jgi:translation initiation factor 1
VKSVPQDFSMTDEKSKLVYSTGKLIPRKDRPGENDANPVHQKPPSGRNVIVRLERKKRGGKTVTVVEGLRVSEKERETLLKQLKTGLGAGGTLRETSLEIQGDHCDALMSTLTKMGYNPKRSGA